MHPERIEPGSEQESVWDDPRPPRLEPTDALVVVASRVVGSFKGGPGTAAW